MKNLDIAIVLYNTKTKQVIKIIDAPGVSEAIQLANKNQPLDRQSMYDEEAPNGFGAIFDSNDVFEKYKEENMITSGITMGEHNMLVNARGKGTAVFKGDKSITDFLEDEDKKTLQKILTQEKDTEGFSDESQKQLTRLVEKQISLNGTDEQKKALATAKKYPRAALKLGGRMAAGIYQTEINNLLDNVDNISGLEVDGVDVAEMIKKKQNYIRNNKSTIIANVVDTLTETDEERKKNIEKEKENATGEENEKEVVDENSTEKGVVIEDENAKEDVVEDINVNVNADADEKEGNVAVNPEQVDAQSDETRVTETTDHTKPPFSGGASNLRKSHKKRKQTKRKNPKKQSKRKIPKNKKA